VTTENLFSAVLMLSLLAGGAVAFGSDVASKHTAPAKTETVVVVAPVGERGDDVLAPKNALA
jgi:hypothetical protein